MPLIFTLLSCSGFGDPANSAGAATSAAPVAKPPTVYTKTILSKPYTIDKMYASMRGPYGFDDVALEQTDKPELLWIVGYKTTVVDANSADAMSQEFMCHANLDFEAKDYYQRFPTSPPVSGRVFTLSQGQDIHFPDGMGILVTSDLPISLATQVLNLNIQNPKALQVRHKVDIFYVRDSEVQGEMIPLFQGAAEGFKALGDAKQYGFDKDEHPEGGECSVGAPAVKGDADTDTYGQQFTAHWVVSPGKEVNTTNVTKFLNLPYDTTVHYIAVHLHPFATELLLKDLTTNKVVFDSHVTPAKDKVGIQSIEHYSSLEGMPMYKSHQYELTSYYDNTTDHDVDSMAVMYMYLKDKNFQKPDLSARAAMPAPKDPKAEKKQPSM